MPRQVRGILAALGRIMLCAIFLMAALGNDIPNFSGTAKFMGSKGIPAPSLMLAGAIVFLIAGGLSVILGFRGRVGAALLLVFLVLATYYFHDFWHVTDPKAKQDQIINFMKNVSMMGAMLLIVAHGTGPMSLDEALARPKARPEGEVVA